MLIAKGGGYYEVNSEQFCDDELHSVERFLEPHRQPLSLTEVHWPSIRIAESWHRRLLVYLVLPVGWQRRYSDDSEPDPLVESEPRCYRRLLVVFQRSINQLVRSR